MMLFAVLVMISVSVCQTYATLDHYHECSEKDCYYYDFPYDSRNIFLDMLQKIEDNANDTFNLPDLKLLFSFSGGTFDYDYDGGDYTCICPLHEKRNKVYAIYHEYLISSYQYNWTLPLTNLSGQFEIATEMFYSIFLLNKTDSLPKVEKINATYFNVFSWWFDGLPLEWLEKLPVAMFKKIVSVPLKPFIENKLTVAYNDAIQKIFSGQGTSQLRKVKKNLRVHRNSLRPLIALKFRTDKKSRKFSPMKLQYAV